MASIQEAFEAAEAELGADTLAGNPADGQVDNEGTDAEQSASTGGESDAPSYFDLDQYGEQLVKIKVDGEDQTVPVSELRNGYMRQAAFTQRTQELAAERDRLQAAETLAAAYERNPYETVRFLAQQQGITLAEAQAQAEAAGEEQGDGWANDAVADPRFGTLDQRLAAIEQREAAMELDRTIAHLSERYGEDFDAKEVVNRALQQGRTDLEAVFKEAAFDKFFARRAAENEVEQRTAQETAQRTQAKQELASTVAGGQSFNGAGDAGSAPITSVADALEAALQEHSDFTL